MSEPTPNADQEALIDGIEGTYLVDAGPGTGKTFAITRRYATVVDQPEVDPEDALLVTFTKSAATEMADRVVEHSSYGARELADAPIRTFHAHCKDLLDEYGHDAPAHLGLAGRITRSTRIVEEEIVETELFRTFLDRFREDRPEHADVFRALSSPTDLLDLIKELAATGIVPTDDGWYRDGAARLAGDVAAFEELFETANRPRNGGRKQSRLRKRLGGFDRDRIYLPDAPSKTELRGERGTKQVVGVGPADVFAEDREAITSFVHDVYYDYLRFALGRNYLNFGFLQLFAFVLLCENRTVREAARFEYVMIDEFQDTSEIQFKLALLLAGTDNLCVVGDWKQSIYSFQYADVANITDFADRLETFTDDLQADADRLAFEPGDIERIELSVNYRSTAEIVDLAEAALSTPATQSENVDAGELPDIVSLTADRSGGPSTIRSYHHEDEHEAVLSLLQDIVGNDDYAVDGEDGDLRAPTHGDIAVFARRRTFGRELVELADSYGIPVAYDGGVELFRTDPAKLLLAWLRILEADTDRGWAVVLERAGYTMDAIDAVLEIGDHPDGMAAFRDELRAFESIGAVARRVFDRYGIEGAVADEVIGTIQAVHDSTTLTRGDLIRFIERGIELGSTHDIHTATGADSVTVQTIHAAKGLEYPIVILADMDRYRFPPQPRETSTIRYEEPLGLRARKVYATAHGHPHVYDNWRYEVMHQCLPKGYDEERRLLYVALTRAERHVCLVGGETPNTFFEELPVEVEPIQPDVEEVGRDTGVQAELPFAVTTPEGPIGLSPHSLMDDDVFEAGGEPPEPPPATVQGVAAGGMDFGQEVHEFAADHARGDGGPPSNDHERRVADFLDGLSGSLMVEEPVTLPMTVDGKRVTISGVVDLVHLTTDTVDVIDFKTDSTRAAADEYRLQLSVYHRVLDTWFDDRSVESAIFYTATGTRDPIDPLSVDDLAGKVRDRTDRF